MTTTRLLILSCGLLAPALACQTVNVGNTLPTNPEDTDFTPPEIVVERPADGQALGQPVTITATVTDLAPSTGDEDDDDGPTEGSGVFEVRLLYHNNASATFESLRMELTGGSDSDVYSATIPGGSVTTSRMFYYVEAEDVAENVATDPDGAPGNNNDRTYRFNIQ